MRKFLLPCLVLVLLLSACGPAEELRTSAAPEQTAAMVNVAVSADGTSAPPQVAQDPKMVGAAGYLAEVARAERVTALRFNAVEPSPDTFHAHSYLLTHRLLLDADLEPAEEKPQLAASADFFVRSLTKESMSVGLHMLENDILNAAHQPWLDAMRK